MSLKDRVEKAMMNHHKSLLPSNKKPRSKRNKAPEKQVVKDQIKWLRSIGCSVYIVEAQAVYSPKAGRYLSSQTKPGTSDICGNNRDGIGVYVESKAKGRRSSLRPDQRDFLEEKIGTNCFAVVSDSVEHLEQVYNEWFGRGRADRRLFLMSLI